MDLKEFCQGIKFNFFQPDEPISEGDVRAEGYERMMDKYRGDRKLMEIANTTFPCDQDKIISRIDKYLYMRRYSTVAIAGIINKAVEQMPSSQCYVNIGFWFGFSLFVAASGNEGKLCIGVDNFSDPENPRQGFMERYRNEAGNYPFLNYFDSNYQEYFLNMHDSASCGPIGVYYYDADHRTEHQKAALILAEPFLVKGSVVMIDDTNSLGVRQSARILLDGGDWEILLDAKTWANQHPTFWDGFLVMRKTK